MFVVGKNRTDIHRPLIFFFPSLYSRDANEQLVLAHVWSKLANVAQILTIHIFKDDWLRHQTHTFMQPQNLHPTSTHNGFVVVT